MVSVGSLKLASLVVCCHSVVSEGGVVGSAADEFAVGLLDLVLLVLLDDALGSSAFAFVFVLLNC